jgi:hypothetical protein
LPALPGFVRPKKSGPDSNVQPPDYRGNINLGVCFGDY